MDTLLDVLLEARRLIALPDNDFSWSSFIDQEAALEELDGRIESLRAGNTKTGGMGVLFLPTGPIQEVSLSSGWGDAFVALADRYDAAVAALQGHAVHLCVLCRQRPATEDRGRRAAPNLVHEHADAGGVGRRPRGDRERREDVFEDDYFHEGIRGACPEGHERLLEH